MCEYRTLFLLFFCMRIIHFHKCNQLQRNFIWHKICSGKYCGLIKESVKLANWEGVCYEYQKFMSKRSRNS